MTKKLLYLFLFLLTTNFAYSQTYSFSKSSSTYSEITGGTVITNEDWDKFTILQFDLPFSFNFFGTNFSDKLYIAGGFATFTYQQIEFGGEIIDDLSGYEMYVYDTDLIGTTSSSISYKVEGSNGSRILKVQWKNARFENDENDEDYANFQLWLYETSGKIEYHYGPISVVNPDSYETPNGGPSATILNEDGSEGIILTGSPSSPTANIPSQALTPFLTGSPSEGTVYVFTKSTTGVVSAQVDQLLNVYPNPFGDIITINNNSKVSINKVNVFKIDGELVYSSTGNLCEINTSDFISGMYVLEIETNKGVARRKLVK